MNTSSAEARNREIACQKLSKEGRKYFDFIEFDENEKMISEIRKHPFGKFLIYAVGIIVIIVLAITSIFISYMDLSEITGGNNSSASLKAILIFLCLIMAVGSFIITLVAKFLYDNNVIFVTNEKIAQVLYVSLFNRKISQLSIGDVQDVTVTQKGIFAHLFKYGTLVIETAGEQQNYTFTFIPEPYVNSKLIVDSHEKNLVKHGN